MVSKRQPMTIRQWWHEVGTDNVRRVVEDVGTSVKYMQLLCYRFKRPSYDMANAIKDAAERITPGFSPDVTLMMQPLDTPQPEVPKRYGRIEPSKRVQRSAA